MSTQTPSDPRFIESDDDSRLRERMQKAEQGHSLRPGALCPHCGGHAFKRAELKRLEQLGKVRDALANKIEKDRTRFDKALDFFHW